MNILDAVKKMKDQFITRQSRVENRHYMEKVRLNIFLHHLLFLST